MALSSAVSSSNGSGVALLQGETLPTSAQQKLKQNSSIVDFEMGAFIVHQGQGAAGIYEILSGRVKVFKTTDEGASHIVRLLHPGQLLGHHAALLRKPHAAAAEALTDVSTRFIPRDDFVSVVTHTPSLALRLLNSLSAEVRQREHQLLSLSQHTVAQRVAEVLLRLEQEHGRDAEGALALHLTRQELANLVGAATETTVRTLTQLKERRLIRTDGRRIWLVDRKRLRRMLDCPTVA